MLKEIEKKTLRNIVENRKQRYSDRVVRLRSAKPYT